MGMGNYLYLGGLPVDRDRELGEPFDYSDLFQASDEFEQIYRRQDWEIQENEEVKCSLSPAVDDEDIEDDEDETEKLAPAFRCPLRTAVARLDLLGYSLSSMRELHEVFRRATQHRVSNTTELPPDPPFEVLIEAIRLVDVPEIDTEQPTKKAPWAPASKWVRSWLSTGTEPYSHLTLDSYFSHPPYEVDPYTMLQLLACNPKNLNLPVTWYAYEEVIDEHFTLESLRVGAKRGAKFLIVTEGSSDTRVIEKAMSLYRSDVFDFFEFIDMDKNYPFTGIGNLHNFYKGLLKIGIQNRVLFVYDNDAVGSEMFALTNELGTIPNIRIMKLPDLDSLVHFPTIGPTGEYEANINGTASAIECFLDLQRIPELSPRVRWTSYNRTIGKYQGELENKDSYIRDFLSLTDSQTSSYDSSKLGVLLDAIIAECVHIATDLSIQEWHAASKQIE